MPETMHRLTTRVPEPETHPGTVHALFPSLQRAEEKGVRCLACSRRCLLHEGNIGFCTAIVNWQERLYSTAYGVIGEATVTPIENRPVYHYRPGTRTLGLGGLGCNLRCAFCQNWEVAFRDAHTGGNLTEPNVLPERAVTLALDQQCDGIAWTFNEPSIAPMYIYDSARLAQEAGLYTVYVTNGFMTHESLQLLGPYLNVYRVDIKSLETAFYQRVASTAHISDILPIARRAQQEFGIHVEAVTNLMPTLNDSDEHLKRLTEQIVTQLGPDTPWHITTYVPYARMLDVCPTPPETLLRARTIGQTMGLKFVYTDSAQAAETANTYCPSCGVLVVERFVHHVTVRALSDDGYCTQCGATLCIVTTSQAHIHQGGNS